MRHVALTKDVVDQAVRLKAIEALKIRDIEELFRKNKIVGEVWQVHDEILVSCPEEYVEQVRKILLK